MLRISADVLDAICAHDGRRLSTWLSADFTLLGSGQRQTREAFLEVVNGADFQVIDKSFETIEVELLGDTAVVAGIQRVTVRGDGDTPIVSRAAFTDVFVLQERTWRLRVACSEELQSGAWN